jgi:hypothetical protein
MQNKRGFSFINYRSESTLIYEFKQHLYIIQRGQQGITLNPEHGSEQRGTEDVKLYAKLAVGCNDNELGVATLEALDAFDTEGPDFEPWENKKLAKHLKTMLGARGQKDIEINSRLVQIIRWLERAGAYEIVPFDNCNIEPWCGSMEGKEILLPPAATAMELGQAIRQAFSVATHHPDYKKTQL